ncbi:hypothetical protein [Algoriphagus winogradskyi]|uniref:Lipoprotein n=1 Tax=Algoriphagus winogradskyi TaxID=237017 RepID=A0ABY1NFH5_9BACT|nr:hypothetical protein [Algoriphagus winogradskyi]SMP08283.1 hypothetical protein SAMN06265367_101727 [Algoriphagus winogradskyi]
MKRLLLFMIGNLLFGCQQEKVTKPEMLNPKATFVVNLDSLLFEAEAREWQAWVSTAVQVIYPEVTQHEQQLSISINPKNGVIEGSAYLTLQAGEDQFVYPIYLRNPKETRNLVDLRSPKTVNTDSSMIQQQILYSYDHSGNLSVLEEGVYFKENSIGLNPKTGTFKGITASRQSSFYVDPGTVTEIPLSISIDDYASTVTFKAGPLVDQYKNEVADGTLVLFLFEKDNYQKRIEAVVKDGYSILTSPYSEVENGKIKVRIAHIYSQTLTIQKL